MTDELTPEEREALKQLPRERMPSAGLEDRVVGAMRDRGVLSAKRPGRVVRITTSRVAGLLAACLVLMIGAYSIGLHRGGDNEVIRSVQTPVRDEATTRWPDDSRLSTPEPVEPEQLARRSTASSPSQALDWKLKDAGERADAPAETRAQMAAPESKEIAEGLAAGGRADEAVGSLKRENQAPAPPAAKMYSTDLVAKSAAPPAQRQLRFKLGGTAFIVDAPDSVRIVQDPEGRMLLIYTSDGIIRIRLAD